MGEVVVFAQKSVNGVANDNNKDTYVGSPTKNNVDLVNYSESTALLIYLRTQGIQVQDTEATLEFNIVMKMVRGMRDRQLGILDSDEYLYLSVMIKAIYEDAVPKDNGEFDELLSHLR